MSTYGCNEIGQERDEKENKSIAEDEVDELGPFRALCREHQLPRRQNENGEIEAH